MIKFRGRIWKNDWIEKGTKNKLWGSYSLFVDRTIYDEQIECEDPHKHVTGSFNLVTTKESKKLLFATKY